MFAEWYELLIRCCANGFDYSAENKLTLGMILFSALWLAWTIMRFNVENNLPAANGMIALPNRKKWMSARLGEYITAYHNGCFWMDAIVQWIQQTFNVEGRQNFIRKFEQLDNQHVLMEDLNAIMELSFCEIIFVWCSNPFLIVFKPPLCLCFI